MRPLTGGKRELLRRLAAMPFLDRIEMAALSGWSQSAVYEAARQLEDDGLIASVPHGTELVAPTRRFHLTADGLRRLAQEEDLTLDSLLRSYPLAARWRRVLLERLDAVAVVYRLASAVANIHHPIRFRWYRAMSMDAAIILPDGRTIGIVRQGHATDRTGFSKRIGRLRDGPQPGGILLVLPDETRLRYARGILRRASTPTVLALEREAAAAATDDAVWRLSSVNAAVSLRDAINRIERRGALPAERPLARVSMPQDIDERGSERGVPEHMLPALLKPTEKRVLDLLSDWPWLALGDLAGLLGVTNQRASQLTTALEGFGLAARVPSAERRLVLTDAGLTLLARRDRAAVGGAKKRWSAAPPDAGAAAGWRSVSGRRSRQLLRDMQHTAAVHGFVAALSRQARVLGWEIDQLDPPRRASRYFRYFGGRRSVHPDAFGMLRRGKTAWPFFLEWERRAVRPVTMAARLAPYLRYYSSHRPIDDHGATPVVLVVFDDDIAQTHFLRVAQGEMDRLRTAVPLLASHRELVEREGPLGRAWFAPGGGFEPVRPLTDMLRRTKAMRIYYIDESEGPRYYVRSALGVNAERWNGLHGRIQDWRTALAGDYSVPTSRELHACDLLAGRGKLARIDNTGRRLTPEQGAEIFMDGLRIIENAAHSLGGIEVVNVCLRKADVKGYEQVSLDRLLNRINTSVAADGRYAHLIFDEGGERMVRRLYGRLRSRNPVPSRYEAWEDGAPTKDIPIERIIGGPSFRSSQDDDLLQMADLIAHALLKQEEEPSQRVTELGIRLAFGILDRALNRRASRTDPQGVVRR